MEKERVMAAIETSKLWLKAADDTRKGGSYNVSLYSAEMSFEIALKAVLMTFDIDAPKTHDVGNVVKKVLRERDSEYIDEKELAETIDLFYFLLGLRNESGYMYDSRASNESFKAAVEKYLEPARKAVSRYMDIAMRRSAG